jgi:hypothetical protein
MNLNDCKTVEEMAEVFFEWDGPKTDYVTLTSAKFFAMEWAKLEYQRGLKRGAELGIEAAADLAAIDAAIYKGGESSSGRIPCERSCAEGEIACRKIGQDIRTLTPEKVIQQKVK